MKSSYATEILIFFISGVAGVCFYNGGWINYLVGFLLVLGTSYFLVSKLKKQTLKEYLIAKSKTQGVLTDTRLIANKEEITK